MLIPTLVVLEVDIYLCVDGPFEGRPWHRV